MADFDPDAYLAQAPAFDPDAYLAGSAAPVESPKPSRKDSILARLSKPEKALAENAPKLFRAYTGLRGTVDAGTQMLERALPETVNYAIDAADQYAYEKTGGVIGQPAPSSEMRTTRKEAANELQPSTLSSQITGDKGVDWYQTAGAVVDPAAWALGTKAFQGMSGLVKNAPKIVKAFAPSMAAGGAVSAAAIPTEEGLSASDFAQEKATQAGIGTAAGAIFPAIGGLASRVVSPKASQNAQLAALKKGGVQPTIGQSLGGAFNTMEEKLQVVPFFGDMITRARGMAKDDFNKMVINEVTAPIGVKINKIGQEGISEAGDAISRHYDDVLSNIKGVKFDDDFVGGLSNLKNLAEYMTPDDSAVFNKILQNEVGSKISSGGVEAITYKQLDSKLGKLATQKRATSPELSDAIRELQALMRDQVARSNPEQAKALDAANAAWAKLVRVERAATQASGKEGVFTPGQLLNAVKGADKSTRKAAVARGEALMQDTATAGQNVLGNKYPDSGTAGRIAAVGGVGAAGYMNPLVLGGVAAGGGAYTRPAQKALVNALTSRPDIAPKIAERLNALGSSADLARLGGISANRIGDK